MPDVKPKIQSQFAGWLGAGYARISLDADGDEEGVGRQQNDNLQWADPRGVELVRDDYTGRAQFVDDDISASKFSRKPRKAYDRLLQVVAEDDRIRVVVAWVVDRFLRRSDELEDLFKLAERRGGLWLATESRVYDLVEADDQVMLRILVAMSGRESQYISKRTKQARKAQRAALQLPHGVIFGWTTDGQSHHPTEAPYVAGMVERLLAGDTLTDVARWLTAEGVPLRLGGKLWTGTTVRNVILTPRHYGHYSYRDPDVLVCDENGRMVKPKRPAVQVLQRDTHRGILPGEMYDGVLALLAAGRQGRGAAPARRTMLTGVVFCGECKRPLNVSTQRGPGQSRVRVWRCLKRWDKPDCCGSVSIRAAALEEWVAEAVWHKVDTVDLARLVAGGKRKSDAGALHTRLAVLDDLTEANVVDLQAGTMSREAFRASDRRISAEREAIKRELGKLSATRVLRPYVGKPGVLQADWPRLSDDLRRRIITEALSLDRLRIEVAPARPGGPRNSVDVSRIGFAKVKQASRRAA